MKLEQVYDSLHDIQAKTIAITQAMTRNTYLVELIEDVRNLIVRDADAGIEYFNANQPALVQATQAYQSLARIFDRIGDKISEHLFDKRGIAMGNVPAWFNLQLQALVRG